MHNSLHNFTTKLKPSFLCAIMSLWLASPLIASDDALAITVYNYPPAITNAEAEPEGEFIDKINVIMAEANVATEWLRIGMNEESQMLDEGTRPFCTTGRLYSEDRGKKWVFFPHIFSSIEPDLVIARKEKASAIEKVQSHKVLLLSPEFKGVFVKGGLYGADLDKILASERKWHSNVGHTDEHVLSLIASGRGDYSIIPAGVWKSLEPSNPELSGLTLVSTRNQKTPRAMIEILLACSKAVEKSKLNKIYQAMDRLGYPLSENHTLLNDQGMPQDH